MASNNLTLRIFDAPEFRAYAFKTVIVENTTLLDHHAADENDDLVLHGWSPLTIDFWMTLLHSADHEVQEALDAFVMTIKGLWSVVSFYELYIRPKKDRSLVAPQQAQATDDHPETEGASLPTLKLRCWFGRWWNDHALEIRETDTADLAQFLMPAFYIGDPETFMYVTHDWFLYTTGRQSSVEIVDESDESGKGALAIQYPVLGKLAAVRSNMINKIEDALPYDEANDGLPRERYDRGGRGGSTKPKFCQDPDWCPKEKTAAYYTALMATGCWPVGAAMQEQSVDQILRDLQKFEYVPYHRVKHLPHREAARAKMPGKEDSKDSSKGDEEGAFQNSTNCDQKAGKENDRPEATREHIGTTKTSCTVCIDAAVKASFHRKVRGLYRRLLEKKQTTVKQFEVTTGQWVLKRVDDSFGGLCLDCLTKTKSASEDDDYWIHCHNFEFDYGCTVKHGQPTWYFSYMGRPESLQQWAKEKRESREKQERARAPAAV